MKKFTLFALLASLLLVTPAFADAVINTSLVFTAQPGDLPPTICIYHRDIEIGIKANPPGVNPLDWRPGLYAFTGERIKYKLVVRDPNGALDIGYVKAFVNNSEEAIANEISLDLNNDGNIDASDACNGLGPVDPITDKAFEIIITVEPEWNKTNEVVLKVFNSQYNPTSATHSEQWFFNPALSMSVTTNDNTNTIIFGPMDPITRVAHSKNKLRVKNTAEGGVNLWVFIAGTDLFATSGSAKCPTSNVLEIEKYMWYRAWGGTTWQSWQGWVQMRKYNQNDGCSVKIGDYWKDLNKNGICDVATEYKGPTCYGGLPLPMPDPEFWPDDIREHILTNQGTVEVEFKIQFPIPCIGNFTSGKIYVFGKAV